MIEIQIKHQTIIGIQTNKKNFGEIRYDNERCELTRDLDSTINSVPFGKPEEEVEFVKIKVN